MLNRLKPAVVEKRWFAVFLVTCAVGLAVGLGFSQLRVHSVIPCLVRYQQNRHQVCSSGTWRLFRGAWHS